MPFLCLQKITTLGRKTERHETKGILSLLTQIDI